MSWKKQRRNALKHYKALGHKRCAYCCEKFGHSKKTMKTVEHLVPKSLGGTLTLANTLIIHAKCNRKRGDTEFSSFVAKHKMPRLNWLLRKYEEAIAYYENVGRELSI